MTPRHRRPRRYLPLAIGWIMLILVLAMLAGGTFGLSAQLGYDRTRQAALRAIGTQAPVTASVSVPHGAMRGRPPVTTITTLAPPDSDGLSAGSDRTRPTPTASPTTTPAPAAPSPAPVTTTVTVTVTVPAPPPPPATTPPVTTSPPVGTPAPTGTPSPTPTDTGTTDPSAPEPSGP